MFVATKKNSWLFCCYVSIVAMASAPTPIVVPARSASVACADAAKRVPVYGTGTPLTELHATVGRQYPEFTDCVSVYMKTDIPLPCGGFDDEIAEAMNVIQGRYWQVGVHNQRKVMRQEVPQAIGALNNREVFMWFCGEESDRGWWFSTEVGTTKGNAHFAWAKDEADGSWPPVQLHVPYYSKTANRFLVLQAQHQYADLQIALLLDDVLAKGGTVSSAGCGDSGGKRGPGQNRSGTRPGGWLMNTARMIVAIEHDDIEKARSLANELQWSPSPALQDCLEIIRRERDWDSKTEWNYRKVRKY